MNATIYHNPRCSKSRATLQLLNDNGVEPEIILYLENPPTSAELSTILGLLEKKPQDIIRFKETKAVEFNLSATDDRSNDEWLELMAKNPTIIERPIVVVNNEKAAMGRPPENVLSIIGK